MYNKNLWFSQIPTVILSPVCEPIFAPLRKPPKAGLVSTAEALIIMLETIGDLEAAQTLRGTLKYAVDIEHWQKEEYIKKYQSEDKNIEKAV